MTKEDIKNSAELAELLDTKDAAQATFPGNSNLLLSYEPSEEVMGELEDFGRSLGRSLHRSQYGSSGQ